MGFIQEVGFIPLQKGVIFRSAYLADDIRCLPEFFRVRFNGSAGITVVPVGIAGSHAGLFLQDDRITQLDQFLDLIRGCRQPCARRYGFLWGHRFSRFSDLDRVCSVHENAGRNQYNWNFQFVSAAERQYTHSFRIGPINLLYMSNNFISAIPIGTVTATRLMYCSQSDKGRHKK